MLGAVGQVAARCSCKRERGRCSTGVCPHFLDGSFFGLEVRCEGLVLAYAAVGTDCVHKIGDLSIVDERVVPVVDPVVGHGFFSFFFFLFFFFWFSFVLVGCLQGELGVQWNHSSWEMGASAAPIAGCSPWLVWWMCVRSFTVVSSGRLSVQGGLLL